ncbi:BMC domain-containing protein [Bacillus sp. REN3]|uniref:BMC domain-containing protein n=1 Tax=Bacillus sp. REN3 TaxID=2802440 RepID=UPI001AED5429|nr:BMC domain-containing protein [Bacillus sp. REN3]
MKQSIGILEVVGNVTALSCADKMVKSSYVEIRSIKRIGTGMIAVIIRGDLASVQHAIAVGQEAAGEHGELVAAKVIPRPYEGLGKLINPSEGGGQ